MSEDGGKFYELFRNQERGRQNLITCIKHSLVISKPYCTNITALPGGSAVGMEYNLQSENQHNQEHLLVEGNCSLYTTAYGCRDSTLSVTLRRKASLVRRGPPHRSTPSSLRSDGGLTPARLRIVGKTSNVEVSSCDTPCNQRQHDQLNSYSTTSNSQKPLPRQNLEAYKKYDSSTPSSTMIKW
jgi:hypothetical protein